MIINFEPKIISLEYKNQLLYVRLITFAIIHTSKNQLLNTLKICRRNKNIFRLTVICTFGILYLNDIYIYFGNLNKNVMFVYPYKPRNL